MVGLKKTVGRVTQNNELILCGLISKYFSKNMSPAHSIIIGPSLSATNASVTELSDETSDFTCHDKIVHVTKGIKSPY